MSVKETDPHSQFCCNIHGCRFNNNDKCTVVKGSITQLSKCGESAICAEYRDAHGIDYDEDPYEH